MQSRGRPDDMVVRPFNVPPWNRLDLSYRPGKACSGEREHECEGFEDEDSGIGHKALGRCGI